jgi:hypothetical protein
MTSRASASSYSGRKNSRIRIMSSSARASPPWAFLVRYLSWNYPAVSTVVFVKHRHGLTRKPSASASMSTSAKGRRACGVLLVFSNSQIVTPLHEPASAPTYPPSFCLLQLLTATFAEHFVHSSDPVRSVRASLRSFRVLPAVPASHMSHVCPTSTQDRLFPYLDQLMPLLFQDLEVC